MRLQLNEPNQPQAIKGSQLKPGELAELLPAKGEIVMRFGTVTDGIVSLTDPTRYWTNGADLDVRRLNQGSIVTLTQDTGRPASGVPVRPRDPNQESRDRIDSVLFAKDRAEVRRLLRKQEVINAIKFVRERTNEGLKEAKDYVDFTRASIPYDEE